MIYHNTEELFTLSQAARLIPSSRSGKKTSPSTLHRWASRGLNGVRLSTIKVGGAQRTSRKFLSEFFEALSIAAGLQTEAVAQPAPDREAEIARATARVKALVG